MLPMPAGVAVGEVLIAALATGTDPVTDATGDWTLVQLSSTGSSAFERLTTFKRVADGTEDASYTFTYASGGRSVGVILRCGGGANVGVSAFTNSTTSATATWPAVTTTSDNNALLLLVGRKFADGVPVTPPAGATTVVHGRTTSQSLDVVTIPQLTAGPSSFGTGSFSTSGQYTAQTLAITFGGDTTPPPVPTGVVVTATTDRSVTLSWTASTAPDWAGYKVFRNGVLVSTQLGTTCCVGDLPAATASSWQVSAYDILGNESAKSAGVTGTTGAAVPVPAGLSAPGAIIEPVLGAPFITLGADGTFNDYQNREHGNAPSDPADPDANRRYKFSWTGLNFDGGAPTLGMAFSGDGLTWAPHPGNPISGPGISVSQRGEDPYLAKNIGDGTAYRDSDNRLLLFCEEIPGGEGTQQGVWLFTSSDHGVTWQSDGRVFDKSAISGAWDSGDRTSPIVFHDGTRLVMLYEGRNLTGVGTENRGMVGVAYSTDEGLTWTPGNGGNPIIDTAVNVAPWGQGGVVPDDLILVGGVYYLTLHGQAVGAGGSSAFNNAGRWKCLNPDPTTWTASDWVEISGNPYDTATSTEMFIGNDGGRIITERDRQNLYVTTLEAVVIPFVGWGIPL